MYAKSLTKGSTAIERAGLVGGHNGGGIVMSKEVDAIMKTIEILFKRLDKTKYCLQISRDKYDKTFNIFLILNMPTII